MKSSWLVRLVVEASADPVPSRLAGHLEDGKDSASEPAIGGFGLANAGRTDAMAEE